MKRFCACLLLGSLAAGQGALATTMTRTQSSSSTLRSGLRLSCSPFVRISIIANSRNAPNCGHYGWRSCRYSTAGENAMHITDDVR